MANKRAAEFVKKMDALRTQKPSQEVIDRINSTQAEPLQTSISKHEDSHSETVHEQIPIRRHA